MRPKGRMRWAPYLLLLPSLLFLLIFFAWPMFRSLTLVFMTEDSILNVRGEPSFASKVVGKLPQTIQVDILGTQGVATQGTGEGAVEEEDEDMLIETWYRVRGQNADGQTVEGWTTAGRIRLDDTWYRVRGQDADGQSIEGWVVDRKVKGGDEANAGTIRSEAEVMAEANPTAEVIGALAQDAEVEILDTAEIMPDVGTVRRKDLEVLAEAGPTAEIVGIIPQDAQVDLVEIIDIEIWFQISGAEEGEATVEGWARSDFIKLISEDGTRGLVEKGDAGEWTTKWVDRMINDREFSEALITTILLMVLILPIQFVLAIVMALVLQSRLRGNTLFLYVFSIPLGVSDLAVGIVWYSVFTQNGFLNSLLSGLGLIDSPGVFLSMESRHWMIIAIVLAEVWRATSIVMVIVVSGLQAIPLETLEAAELFGAGLWQRLRHIILPLLKPSLQVALILRTILAFQVFGVVIAIAGRGLTVLSAEAYRWYVEFQNEHVAGAYAGFILIISMISAIFYLRLVQTQEAAAR